MTAVINQGGVNFPAQTNNLPAILIAPTAEGALSVSDLTAFEAAGPHILQWLSSPDLKTETRRVYSHGLRHFLEFISVTGTGFHEVNVDVVTDYKQFLTESDLSENTQVLYIRAVRSFYRWYGAHGGKDHACTVSASVSDVMFKKDPVTREEYDRILSVIDTTTLFGLRDYTMTKMLYATGMRSMSIRGLRWGDMETMAGYPAIRYNKKGRGKRTDLAPLPPAASIMLEQYRQVLANNGVSTGHQDFIFPALTGDMREMSHDTVYSRICGYMRMAGVYVKGKKTPHSFRHGAAISILEKTGDRTTVKIFLGHANSSTSEIYTAMKDRMDVFKKAGDIMDGIV